MTKRFSSKNVISQERVGWPTSGLVKIIAVLVATYDTSSMSSDEIDRKYGKVRKCQKTASDSQITDIFDERSMNLTATSAAPHK